jgi:LacI family transcriptional regulator/LacI family repressor for deo operon, udp, cdd, tsx, nupC, and nupG
MTVCLALRERSGVSLETRERVQQAAAELGYRPDPVLNALNAYKYSRRLTHYSGTLAFLDLRRAAGGRRYRYITSYLAGARRRAEALGYKVEEFSTQPAKLAAVARVLEHRGVPGVLLSPLAEAEGDLDFPWDKFSALTFGFSLRNPDLHRIALHHFEAMRRCLRELAALGYRRIGLCLLHEQDARVHGQYTGAFWSEQRARERTGHTLLTPLLLPAWDETAPAPSIC